VQQREMVGWGGPSRERCGSRTRDDRRHGRSRDGDHDYVATGNVLHELSPVLSWSEMFRAPQIEVEWPFLPSGTRYLLAPRACLEGQGAREVSSAPRPVAETSAVAARFEVSVFPAIRPERNPYRVYLLDKEWGCVNRCGISRRRHERSRQIGGTPRWSCPWPQFKVGR
jgi:hypothetical protein